MDLWLKDKVVLITGGGSGLGLSMAKFCHAQGAKIAICGRRSTVLQSAALEISSNPSDVCAVPTDIRDELAVERLFDAVEGSVGPVDCLINNAAGNFLCCSEDVSSNAFQSIVNTVLLGTFHCTQRFAKNLRAQQKPGSVVTIATSYAETGSAFVLPSACAKAGVVALTKSLAYEWAEFNIRLNAVLPGPFPTKGAWERLIPGKNFEQEFIDELPMKRFGEHHELATVVAFLLSDLASYVSGDCIAVDGGEKLKNGQFNFLLEKHSREELRTLFTAMRKKS